MSIIDCLLPKLPRELRDDIETQYNTFLRTSRGDTLQADAAFMEWLPTWRNQTVRARVNSALAAERVEQRVVRIQTDMQGYWDTLSDKSKKWAKFIKSRQEPTRDNAIEKLYTQADLAARQGANELLGELSELYKRAAPKGFTLDADRRVMGDVLNGLIDGIETVTDPSVRAITGELRQVLTQALNAYRSAGGLIGSIENYVPIRHNAAKIREVGFDEWFDAYRGMTDISQVVDYRTGKYVSEERFREIALDMYDDIRTDGATRAARQAASGQSKRFKNPDMFSRRMQARLSKPRDAKAFRAYNERFGVGDDGMFDLITSNLESIGRDTGIMRTLGPTPYALNDGLVNSVKIAGGSDASVARTEALFRTLVGHWNGSVDGLVGKMGTNLHNLLSSSLLGTASVAALGDKPFAANTARLNGLVNAQGRMSDYISSIKNDPDQLLRTLRVAEALSHSAVSRFDGTMAVTPTGRAMTALNNLKNLNHRVSGLERLTHATGNVISLNFFSELGDQASKGVKWGDLNDDFRRLLSRADLTPDEWQRIADLGPDDRGFITPDWLPDAMSETARKLSVVNLELRQYATNSPDLRQRMWSTGNRFGAQVQGDLGNVMSSLIFQFKSFPMTVWRNHFVPASVRVANGDVAPAATLFMQTLFYGALIVQTKELLKGQSTMDWDDPKLWLKAGWQAGSFGLFSDLLFKDPEAYGRNLVAELAGPGPSVAANIVQKTLGGLATAVIEGEEGNVNWSGITNAYKPLVPLSTLWYAKAAFNRTIMDWLNAADPDYYENVKRYNAELQDERGSAGWWQRGEATPEAFQ